MIVYYFDKKLEESIMVSNNYEFNVIAHKNYTSTQSSHTEHLFLPLVERYHLPSLKETVKTCYSKLEAIREQLSDLKNSASNVSEEQRNIIRAYLTDCGLLFAQTRENDYRYNMSSHKNACYIGDGKPFDDFFNEKCQYVVTAKNWTACALEHFYLANDALKQDCGKLESVSLFGTYDNGKTFERICDDGRREVVSSWCDNIKIRVGESAPTVCAKQYFQDKIPGITEEELFWYLGYILPECLGHINDEAEGYTPRLADDKRGLFQKQLEKYEQLKLESWTPMLQYLRRLFFPDADDLECIVRNTLKGTCLEEDLKNKLFEAFTAYTKETTGEDLKRGNQASKRIDELATVFCSSNSESQKMICLERPEVIFFLFRAPEKKSVRYPEKGYSIKRDLKRASRVPIASSTFEADKRLFLSILEVCNEWKKIEGYTEWRLIWNELLPQVLKCVHLGVGNLVYYNRKTSYILLEREKKREHLDFWVKSNVERSAPPFYCDICNSLFRVESNIDELDLRAEDYFRVLVDPLGQCREICSNGERDILQAAIKRIKEKIVWKNVRLNLDETTIKHIVGTYRKNETTREWKEIEGKEIFQYIYTE